MTVNDIVALANAGFTADQIAQLGSVAQQPVQQTVVQPAQQPVQQTVRQPVQQPVQQTVQQPVVQPAQQESDPFNKIMQQLGMLNTSIQANSLLAAQQPKQESVEDVLASIINPPSNDEKGGKNNG